MSAIVLDENTPFGEWAFHWSKRKIIGKDYKYRQSISSLLKHSEPISKMPICTVSFIEVQDILLDLSERNPNTNKPSSYKLLKNVRQTIAAVFTFAINTCNGLYRNPADVVEIPTGAGTAERQAITLEQQMKIVETPHRARLAALIMMTCGLRLGELMALQWADIDFSGRVINVDRSAHNVNGNVLKVKDGTKNGKKRRVPIPKILFDKLMNEYLNSMDKNGFVITKADGFSMHTRSSWERMWESYIRTLGFKFTAHQLRHTYATMLYRSGVDVKSASELLGHSKIEITMNIYTHLMEETKIISIDKYDEFLENFFKIV